MQRHLKQFVSTSSLLSLARVAGAAAGFATQILLARTLQASGLGVFYSATSLAAVMGVVAALGYPEIAPRFVSRYREKGPKGLLQAFVAHARKTTAVCAAIATAVVLAFAALWPGLPVEVRLATTAAALAIPANAALRLNGALAASVRQFAVAYLPDTCIRPFLLLACLLLLVAIGAPLTASIATGLLTLILIVLAVVQYRLLSKAVRQQEERIVATSPRYVRTWRREAPPLILVALYTNFFADVAILLVTPLLPSAETAIVGLCLKLALLVGFAVQVAHQVTVPDLADAHARKEHHAIHAIVLRSIGFPLAATLSALLVIALWGETILMLFGPEFTGAKVPLLILLACQLLRVLFGPNVSLLSVIGAQRQNAILAVIALAVLAAANIVLVPTWGVVGAALAVAVATVVWLGACAVVLSRVSGLRTDVLYLAAHAAAQRR
ncbi:MAG: lipopolysaccharide biosynthesis protein [Methyloceanibacter sp.]|nr:lipopolysaccharide biosynthesis protein [Methyloceanibacter sp.]